MIKRPSPGTSRRSMTSGALSAFASNSDSPANPGFTGDEESATETQDLASANALDDYALSHRWPRASKAGTRRSCLRVCVNHWQFRVQKRGLYSQWWSTTDLDQLGLLE